MIYEKFGNLQPREVFIYRGRYYIRTGIVTADNMFDGKVATFNFDDLVIKNVALPQTTENRKERVITIRIPAQIHSVDINMVFA